MSNVIETKIDGSALVVRFIRPELRNPLSISVLDELDEIVSALDQTTIIFTGSKNVFASGADLREIASVDAANAKEFARRGQDLFSRINALPQSIAAINGFCFGGALDLALACKKRIASPNTVFSHPGANLGIMTGWGGTQRLPRLIGQCRALEMFFLAKRISADEALKIGIIDQICSDPLAEALRLCENP